MWINLVLLPLNTAMAVWVYEPESEYQPFVFWLNVVAAVMQFAVLLLRVLGV